MQTITVSRNDEIYETFADVAQAADDGPERKGRGL